MACFHAEGNTLAWSEQSKMFTNAGRILGRHSFRKVTGISSGPFALDLAARTASAMFDPDTCLK